MKFILKVGDKDLVTPDFSFLEHKNKIGCFVLLLENFNPDEYLHIHQSIKDNKYEIQMENAVLGLTIDNNLYCFDLNDYIEKILNEERDSFQIGFTCLDKDGNRVDQSISLITLSCE